MRRAFALLAASCSLRESRADTLIEAVVRTSNMSSPAYWEAHHVLARLRPGDSWFGPLTRKFARDYVALRYARACAPGAAVVLGSGYSKSPYWLARTGAFRAVLGVDASASAVGAMRRFAASRAHGGGGWDRVRFLHRDAADLGLASGAASLVVDEGVLDVLQGVDGGRTAASRARMAAHLAEAARIVAPGGELVVVGFAGPAGVVNATALGAAACWARAAADAESPARRDSPYFVHDLDRLYRQRRDPRRACSPFGPGAYLLSRPRYASRGRRGGRWCRARVALPPHVGVAGDGASTRWSSANAKSAALFGPLWPARCTTKSPAA